MCICFGLRQDRIVDMLVMGISLGSSLVKMYKHSQVIPFLKGNSIHIKVCLKVFGSTTAYLKNSCIEPLWLQKESCAKSDKLPQVMSLDSALKTWGGVVRMKDMKQEKIIKCQTETL